MSSMYHQSTHTLLNWVYYFVKFKDMDQSPYIPTSEDNYTGQCGVNCLGNGEQ